MSALDFSGAGSVVVHSAAEMRVVGEAIGRAISQGTVVVLTGPLGAGKTTLTQGIAVGLGVRGRVQSPTFTVVRTHKPGGVGMPGLLHMDAYRLLGREVSESVAPGEVMDRHVVLDALEALDIDADISEVVVVAEWGRGVVELLNDKVLDVEIFRDAALEGAEPSSAGGELGARPVQQKWETEMTNADRTADVLLEDLIESGDEVRKVAWRWIGSDK